jgi:dipeptidyl aminopeptidase/acylaminoacyl peptidase
LWRVPLLDRQAQDQDVRPYALLTTRALSPRFGGTSLFYLSAQGSGDGLLRFHDGQLSEVWKADNDSLTEPPAPSPDGTRVVIVTRQDGKRRLAIMSADGTNARTLAGSLTIQGSGGQGSADWSPDGAWIVAAGTDAQGPGLFKIAVDGGAPVAYCHQSRHLSNRSLARQSCSTPREDPGNRPSPRAPVELDSSSFSRPLALEARKCRRTFTAPDPSSHPASPGADRRKTRACQSSGWQ